MMKHISFLLLLALIACKSARTELPLLQNCPANGDCEVQVLKETKLFLTETVTGVSDVTFEEDVNFQVVFIKFKKSGTEDYAEEIYLQIPSQFKEIQSKNYSLQNQKVVFGKFCDCEEEGFELIRKGELVAVNKKEHISLQLEFNSEKSQILKKINLDI